MSLSLHPPLQDLRERLSSGRAALRERAAGGATGREIVRGTSALVDEVVRAAFAEAVGRTGHAGRVALVAIGGYGRKDLAPHSDVDLLLLFPDGEEPPQALAEALFTSLWDLRLELGASTRSPSECARVAGEDHTARTALLDCRLVTGDAGLYAELEQRVLRDLTARQVDELISAKTAELERRRQRFGGSVHLLEPNVKQSPGALRDLQAALWIARARHRAAGLSDLLARGILPRREVERLKAARDLLWRVRNQLHWIAGKKEDHLTFQHQEQVAHELGYRDRQPEGLAVEQFMRDYYLAAEAIRRLADELIDRCAPSRPGAPAPERTVAPGLKLWQGRLTLDRESLSRDPSLFVRIFTVAEELGVRLYPFARDLVREEAARIDDAVRSDPRVTSALKEALARMTRAEWMREMHREGVLGALLPEFGRVTAKHQHDLYHVYTVDSHSIFAVQRLGSLRAGDLVDQEPELSLQVREIARPLALVLGVLFHDAGKGMGGNHSEKGAELVKAVCARLGVPERDAADAEFLVREHLAMSHVSQRRDLSDPELIADFARRMGDRDRLDMLHVLTYVDIASVGPGTWTSWKAGLLHELHRKTAAALEGEPGLRPELGAFREALEGSGIGPARAAAFLDRLPRRYAIFADPSDARTHLRILELAHRTGLAAVARDRGSLTVLTVSTEDRPGLLASIAGVLAAHRIDVLRADVFSTSDGRALDVFAVRGPRGGALERGRLRAARRDLSRVLRGETTAAELRRRLLRPSGLPPRHVPAVETRVKVDNRASRRFTVVDVAARDRAGLLADVTSALHRAGLTILVARITTEGHRAVDAFYVADPSGAKVEGGAAIAALEAAVVQAIEQG